MDSSLTRRTPHPVMVTIRETGDYISLPYCPTIPSLQKPKPKGGQFGLSSSTCSPEMVGYDLGVFSLPLNPKPFIKTKPFPGVEMVGMKGYCIRELLMARTRTFKVYMSYSLNS